MTFFTVSKTRVWPGSPLGARNFSRRVSFEARKCLREGERALSKLENFRGERVRNLCGREGVLRSNVMLYNASFAYFILNFGILEGFFEILERG